MKRLIIGSFVGFQLVNDATSDMETVELQETEAKYLDEALSKGLVVVNGFKEIPFDSPDFPKAIAEYNEAAAKHPYYVAKAKEAADRVQLEDETPLSEKIKSAELGFVNNHVSNELDGRGDKKWYPLRSGKTQHEGDTVMTRSEAIANNIVIG